MRAVTLHHLAVQGFRSFQKDVVFTFPKRPGFYLLDGDNGAGKSSVWGALTWLLYGRTDRGLKAGDVANWEREHLTTVAGEFTVDGQLYGLTRTWNPNSLNLERGDGEPKPVTQEEVDALIGLDYDGFLHTVFISQFADTFFDLGKAERLQLFGEALDLTFWEQRGDLARRKAKEASDTLQADKNALEGKRGRLEALRESKRRLRGEVEEFKRKRGEEIARCKANLAEGEDELARLLGRIAKLEERVRRRKARVDKLTQLVVRETKAQRVAEREAVRLEAELRGARRERARLLADAVAVSKLTGKCPTCRQSIKTGHTRKVTEHIHLEAGVLDAETQHITDRFNRATAEVKRLDKHLRSLATQHDEAEAMLVAVNRKVRKLEGEAGELRAFIESRNRELEYLRKPNPVAKEYERVKGDFIGLCAVVADDTARVEKLETSVVALEKVATTFKELRLWLIEEALSELEVEVNNALLQLGLDGWAVTFEVEQETKSGTVSRGFHVLIESPESRGQVKWESWSGGETQRLRIAGAIGLAAVIRSRRGLVIPLEIWDEPTTFIQEEGIQDLLTFLQSRAREDGRQIWLIDHRSHTFGFDGHVTVRKGDEGSKLIVRKADKA